MDEKIKLIWDFHGPDARHFAEHHAIHLSEFAIREKLSLNETGSMSLSEQHWIAFMIVLKDDMLKVRDALRPKRAESI